MATPTDVVIAGSKPFALSLFAPVTERAGTRPRIAPEPAVALTLCAESSGVLVVEYQPHWLPALTQLRRQRPGLRVVAALGSGQEGAALSLGPLSIEAVPWDGQAVSVMAAIERAIGGGPPGPLAPPAPARASTQARAPAVASASTPQAAAPAALDLFADLGASVATPLPQAMAAVPAPAPAPRTGAPLWPATGPSAAEAERALGAVLGGGTDLSPLGEVAGRVAAGLSSLEREVFTRGAVPVDAGTVRHAAVLRLRVAAALATRPAPGQPVDDSAVAELLAEIDGLLGAVKALLVDATPRVREPLEAIRNALVKEAVDFSEACHEIGTAELPLEPSRAGGRSSSRAAPVARFLTTVRGDDEREVAERKRGRVAWILLALAVLGAGALHGYRWWTTEQAVAQMKTLPGQPDRMLLLPAPPGATTQELVPQGGVPDRAQVEQFKAQQKLQGNSVTETSLGGLRITTERAEPQAGSKRSTP
jgi:hypothetical protein